MKLIEIAHAAIPFVDDKLVPAFTQVQITLTTAARIIATIFVIVGGYYYITGGASEGNIEKAHRFLLWAAIGFGVVLLADSIAAFFA